MRERGGVGERESERERGRERERESEREGGGGVGGRERERETEREQYLLVRRQLQAVLLRSLHLAVLTNSAQIVGIRSQLLKMIVRQRKLQQKERNISNKCKYLEIHIPERMGGTIKDDNEGYQLKHA